jgi:flagellar biogenesis protein FliO
LSIVLLAGVLCISGQVTYAQTAEAETSVPSGAVIDDTGAESVRPVSPDENELVFEGGEQSAPGTAAGEDDLSAFGIWDLLRMVLVLLLVVGAVYGLVMLLRRRVGADPDESDSPIRVLASRTLSGNRDIHAVMVGKTVLLLGGGDGGVQLLATLDDQETIDELVLAHSSTRADGRKTFGRILGNWIGNFTVPGTNDSSGTGRGDSSAAKQSGISGFGGGFFRTQQDRLRHMR